ncbi:MAG: BTAD domain-containing putative transcriptional regulator [Roseiflexaceae bacterium]
MLWGEQADADAATNLRQALANLRRLLEPYLVITRQTVAFNHDNPAWIDVTQFERDLATPEGDRRRQAALELYRGDFLDGFNVRDAPAFEEWALAERERLRELALSGLHMLATEHTARGEYAAGIAAATRLLALDPWREEGHRQLMLLLARSGQRSAALAQYETCRRILAQELGVAPMPETSALCERIRLAQPAHSAAAQTPATSLIGRTDERAELARRLADPACRLLTIVGPGGIGKTRLAHQAVIDHRQGFLHSSYFVALAAATSVDALIAAIAGTLGFTFYGGADPRTQLFNYLGEKELLLVLDNFEQLIEGGADLLSELLQHTGDVKLLVTSRERLRLHGEWLLELHGLPVPPALPTDALESYSAVQLFLERAQRIDAHFELSSENNLALVQVCRLVEGMPLGIELAAAWVRTLSCAEIMHEIEAGLDVLATSLRDLPERQRSMRAVFDYSWCLLTEHERATLSQLSVFRGGFTRTAVAAVQNSKSNPAELLTLNSNLLTTLAALVDKSLLRRNGAGRYELHELVRQYAADQLQAGGEHAATCDRHCDYYLTLLHTQTQPLQGYQQQQAIAEIGAEIENVRAAWQWASATGKVDAIERALESLYRYYDIGSWFKEGVTAFGSAAEALASLNKLPSTQHEIVLGQLLLHQSWFCIRVGSYKQAEALLLHSLTLLRRAKRDARSDIARALIGQGYLVILSGEYLRGRALSQEALTLFQALGDQNGIADALNNLGIIADMLGEYREAKGYYQQNLAIHQALGDRKGIARATHNLADTCRLLGEFHEASTLEQASLTIARAIGDHMLEAYALACLGIVSFALGKHTDAQQSLEEGLALFKTIGYKVGVVFCDNHLGLLASAQGDYGAAGRCFQEALAIALDMQVLPEILEVLQGIAANLAKTGAPARAIELLAVIANHPASYQHSRESAEQLLAELQAQVVPAIGMDAYARGQAHELNALVAELVDGGR